MSTNRQNLKTGQLRADMGAQCISLNCSEPSSVEVMDLLLGAGVCAEVPQSCLSSTPERQTGESWRHLVGIGGGVNDALKKLLDEAKAKVEFQRRVASLDDVQGRWRATPFNSEPETFDAVIMAVPGSGVGGDNLGKIHGTWEKMISAEQRRQLKGVEHDARWSVALFLSPACAMACDTYFGDSAVEKVVDDDILHLLCYQSKKTSQAGGLPPTAGIVVVAHTTHQWAQAHIRASGRDGKLTAEILERARATIGLPLPLSKVLLASKVITWKQCQVTSPLPTPGQPCMLLAAAPAQAPVALCGDYFVGSSFSGCLRSGFGAAEMVAKKLLDA